VADARGTRVLANHGAALAVGQERLLCRSRCGKQIDVRWAGTGAGRHDKQSHECHTAKQPHNTKTLLTCGLRASPVGTQPRYQNPASSKEGRGGHNTAATVSHRTYRTSMWWRQSVMALSMPSHQCQVVLSHQLDTKTRTALSFESTPPRTCWLAFVGYGP